ncbi:SPOR domain-containing protein [Lacimonas salitolerans]|uniref:SPOR domain-containing protein n=1 Tax=Lacimonas salitolerans TaxID=1323750 RepID=A0ABW4EIM2_9RHOB
MADYYADAQGEQPAQSASIGTLANWVGAAISVALIIGIAVWGYKLLVRDVSGVPVVRAAEGPMRIQPDDPGGRPADHQGLAVNAVAAVGTAADPADRLVLAPRATDLTDEDAPAALLSVSLDTQPKEVQSNAEAGEVSGDDPVQVSAGVDDLVAQLTNGATPLSAADGMDETAADDEAQDAPRTDRPTTGLSRSLRPQLRPAGVAQRVASIDPAAGLTTTVKDIDPTEIPTGTRLAQLGAYDSGDLARSEWDRLQARFGEYMQGKDRVIERAESGGRTFYRLRAMGFEDLADARRFCAAFVAQNSDCIPVVTR